MTVAEYEVEAMGEAAGQCECCGKPSQSIWGVVHRAGAESVASYFLQWTPGADLAAHPANLDMIIGAWGEGTGAADRVAVSMLYGEGEAGPAVMVIDAKPRRIAKNPLVGAALERDEVIGTPMAKAVFDIFDAVFAQDARFKV
jgi:hypothetical protein